ncbi:hypothetical protein HG264_08215 [Pseudomonas sp. gcc21]|uniref:DUF7281 domain-containing protein n=1 Tax=Pseudomonas sp. gcc21 TaxID=2726989 RepID=UPI001451F2E5|nr:hypothetical protein [Pseudomonas sp. gcc21]QJD58896.1 hypothetical protein HG264_08215 [Pseudomonas sp. gcc21]
MRTRKRKVPLTRVWLSIHEEYGVGIRSRSSLDLSDSDLDKLYTAARRLTRHDPLSLDIEKSRTDLSADTAQDKLGSQPVFRMVRVATTDGLVEMRDDNGAIVQIPCLPGMYVGVCGAKLVINPERIDQVIIIENGSAMERWWDITHMLPERYRQRSLFVYRGHGADAAALLGTLEALPDSVAILFFGDFDPSGIDIALGVGKHLGRCHIALLAPAEPGKLVQTMSKPGTFEKQYPCLQRLLELNRSAELMKLLASIRQNGWAVTQESLIAHRIPLAIYSV